MAANDIKSTVTHALKTNSIDIEDVKTSKILLRIGASYKIESSSSHIKESRTQQYINICDMTTIHIRT